MDMNLTAGKKNTSPTGKQGSGVSRLRPGLADVMAGEKRYFQETLLTYLPIDLIGGSVPHIAGMEDEAVWNAAAQACATEKVHYCYSVEGDRIWYLACPSASLASNPNSWCPLAAALPGQSEFWDKETVYLYEQDGVASALRWDPDTGRMQVFLGAARTIMPRLQSMDTNFVTINPDIAKPLPWKNRALRSEQLSRATTMVLLLSGVLCSLIGIGVIVVQLTLSAMIRGDLQKVRNDTAQASQQLMVNAYAAIQSDTLRHMVRIQEILDTLGSIQGTLVRYEVRGDKVEWQALVPASCQGNLPNLRGTIQPELEKDGRARLKGTR